MSRTKKILSANLDLTNLISFGFLANICPITLIDEVLEKFDKASKRVRLLPANLAVYLIITMSLWRESSTDEIIKILCENINALNSDQKLFNCPGKVAISQARTKLGPNVLREIAGRIITPIAPSSLKEAWFRGKRLMALDGTTFDLPDEAENVKHFGYPSSSRGETAFPQARVLSLVETGTHVVTAADIGPYKRSEQEMAKTIFQAGKLKSNMLLLADRNFYGYNLWSKAISTGAKLLWRIKTNLNLPVEKMLDDGSYISTVYDSRNRAKCKPIKVRVIEYILNGNFQISDQSPGEKVYRLLTNMTDPKSGSAEELAKLYHERWEIETLFGEFKKSILGYSTVVRSKTPLLVEQELWGLIIIHFAVRKLMAQAAWKHNIDPDKLSFKSTIHIVRRKLPHLAAFPPRNDEEQDFGG
ncbi:MAG: IS4 family transposase [Deltaproteobacteria bacterium]|nr:IS4 family transposase [Deltaproteobacteria bacterium]